MKSITLFIAVLFGMQIAVAQSHFENIYASSTTTYDGMADGGVSYGFAYTFIAHNHLTLPYVYFEDKALELSEGDSVIFNGSYFNPYQMDNDLYGDSEEQVDTTIQKTFYASKRNGIYYVGVPYQKTWEYARKYRIGAKTYTARTKKNFDEAKEFAMP